MLDFIKIYYMADKMKRTFILIIISMFLVSCGAASTSQVNTPDVAAYKAVKITSESNSERIVKLETELDKARTEINTLRTQNRQLADSYDSLVELFKEHRGLTMTILSKMNSLFAPEEEKSSE
ncbi:MAG: hypothetical protein C0602_01075 [Denitrovibrio sp.]|nr:MAG: hypothetical protein C0602_01075 [Denitrovibrio sp.]